MRHSFPVPVLYCDRGPAQTRRHVYERVGNNLRLELLANIAAMRGVDPAVDEKFGMPFRAFDGGYEVVQLGSDAGFLIDPGRRRILINRTPLDLLCNAVGRYRPELAKETSRGIRQILVESYFLHEIQHIPQGIWDFPGVQQVKKNVGSYAIAALDLIADVKGARILAGLQTIRQGGPWGEHYLFYLLQNLVVAGEFAVRVFGAPLSKPHKVWRALGLAATAAVVHHTLRERKIGKLEYVTLPPDCIMQPVFSEAMDSLSILALTPELKVLHPNIQVDPGELARLAERVDEGQFLRSVVAMGQILKRAGLLA